MMVKWIGYNKMLIILKENIDYICLIIEGIIFIYFCYIYIKNRNKKSNEVIIPKKTVKIILIMLIVVNTIFFTYKIINMLRIWLN